MIRLYKYTIQHILENTPYIFFCVLLCCLVFYIFSIKYVNMYFFYNLYYLFLKLYKEKIHYIY